MQILISDRDNAPDRYRDFAPTHVVSYTTKPFRGEPEGGDTYLKIDISKNVAATEDRLLPLISFLHLVPSDARLFIACDFGVSRSATTALLAMCISDPTTAPADHYAAMREHWPRIVPQRGMVRVGDKLLGLGGELEVSLLTDTRQRIGSLAVLEVEADETPRPMELKNRGSRLRRRIKTGLIKLAQRL